VGSAAVGGGAPAASSTPTSWAAAVTFKGVVLKGVDGEIATASSSTATRRLLSVGLSAASAASLVGGEGHAGSDERISSHPSV